MSHDRPVMCSSGLSRRWGRLLALVSIAGMVAGPVASVAAAADPAATHAPARLDDAARAARARALATGHARANARGQGGGQGAGRANGRTMVPRTATAPPVTPAEEQLQQRLATRPVLTPKLWRTGRATAHGTPTSPPSAGASRPATPTLPSGPSPKAATRTPQSPGDFNYFRNTDVTPAANGHAGSYDEPSVANDGNVVLYTGNTYAAESVDSGHTFSYINPVNVGTPPTLPQGGVCCDQVAIHSPSASDITAWGILYWPVNGGNGGDNIIRLAVARNQADLSTATFDWYDFSAQTFGFPEGDWIDYPHLGLGAHSLYLSVNIFNGQNFQDSIMVRYDLSSFTAGTWSAEWYYNNQDFTWTPTDTSTDTFGYWAATTSGFLGNGVRVYNWQEGTDYTHVNWNDFGANYTFENQDGSCPAPDGLNWCGFDDSRTKTGGEIGTSTVYFLWDAKQDGSFPYPYVDVSYFDVSTGPATSISEHYIWNANYAWAYPGLAVNAAGNLGLSIAIGGGTWGYPGSQFGLAEGNGFSFFYLDQGSHSRNRWGDYLTARPATYPGAMENSFVVTGYVNHDDGSGNSVVNPHFYWVGRQLYDPFFPQFLNGYANGLTEGNAATGDTSLFYGPSACACDYYASNAWGDGIVDTASIRAGSGTGFYITSGTHTYAEEGGYATTTAIYDYWSATATGTGSSTVADAALTTAGQSLAGVAGQSLNGVVATFTDADPGGTVSDYSATINWGDGSSSSAGSIGPGVQVRGTHTYALAGTYTVTTAINDAGGASTTATGTAGIRSAPLISSVAPKGGPLGGGQPVTITGSQFTGASAVKFGTTPATAFTVVNDTTITATTPAHAAGVVDVRVTNSLGTSSVTATGRYAYETAPTVTSVTPNAGPVGGGGTVTITGTNFTAATAISFGTVAATAFTVVSSTKITARAPAHAGGTVNVRVTTPSGTSAPVAADRYTYALKPTVTSVSPASGSHRGGTTVTIRGSHFTGATLVEFGTTPAASFTIVSDTEISAKSPSHPSVTVDVRVKSAGGLSDPTPADRFKFV